MRSVICPNQPPSRMGRYWTAQSMMTYETPSVAAHVLTFTGQQPYPGLRLLRSVNKRLLLAAIILWTITLLLSTAPA